MSGSKTKTLCHWSKSDIEKKLNKLGKIVRRPKFVCGNCARAAGTKARLCNPTRL